MTEIDARKADDRVPDVGTPPAPHAPRAPRTPPAPVRGQEPGAITEILAAVRDSAMQLLSAAPVLPSRLQVRAGGCYVQLEWRGTGPDTRSGAVHEESGATAAGVGGLPSVNGDRGAAADVICAPTVGVFYRAPEPGAAPFVREGDTIHAEQQVAILETMKLMLPVEADRPGRIVKALRSDGDPVEYGEPLFELIPEHY